MTVRFSRDAREGFATGLAVASILLAVFMAGFYFGYDTAHNELRRGNVAAHRLMAE